VVFLRASERIRLRVSGSRCSRSHLELYRSQASTEVVLDTPVSNYSFLRHLSVTRSLLPQFSAELLAAFLRCICQRVRSRRLGSQVLSTTVLPSEVSEGQRMIHLTKR
jgi:hypothetical protein